MKPLVVAFVALLPRFSYADEMVAIRPGMICHEAGALAALTLPDGSARTQHPASTARDRKAAAEGGCRDIVVGERVNVVTSHPNTSVVLLPASSPTAGTFVVPNVDFAAAVPAPAAAPAVAPSVAPAAAPSAPPSAALATAPDAPPAPAQPATARAAAAAMRTGSAAPPPPAPGPAAEHAAVPPGGAAAPAWDITGITLGMTPDQVRATLAQGLVVKTQPLAGDTALMGMSAQTENGSLNYGDDDYQAYGMVFFDGTLVFVEHIQKFSPGKEPSTDDVTAALTAKYGQRSVFSGPQGIWARDADGRPEGGHVDLCASTQFKMGLPLVNKNIRMGQVMDQVNVPVQAPNFPLYDMSKICFDVLAASSRTAENRALIAQTDVWLQNYQPFFEEQRRKDQAAKDKVNQQITAAHQNKPNL